ncbi:hypothetical protein GQ600_18103 [Phytophthora cactorum]|nr:hypothetical protein GQ600_18103 [Phytophthora cactorum]
MPRMAINMAWSAQWAALGPYLSTMLSNSAVQATQFIGPIVGVIVGPVSVSSVTAPPPDSIGDALGDHGDGAAGDMDRKWTSYALVHGQLSVIMFVCVAVATIFAHETPLDPSKVEQVSAWTQVKGAFYSVWLGIRTLPKVLVVYAIGFFFVQYGYTAYNGNKGQFFGLEVYGGTSTNADSCDPCSVEQIAYNDGVSLAGGDAIWLTILSATSTRGACPTWLRRFVVAICGMTSSVWFSCIVPIIIHVMGDDVEIGMYVGALNSANCFGQLLNFAIGTAIVDTSLGYKLPVFIAGIMTALGFVTAAIFMKIKMYSL